MSNLQVQGYKPSWQRAWLKGHAKLCYSKTLDPITQSNRDTMPDHNNMEVRFQVAGNSYIPDGRLASCHWAVRLIQGPLCGQVEGEPIPFRRVEVHLVLIWQACSGLLFKVL